MAPRTHSVESGLGSEESGSESAMREFFQSYMPQLEMAVRGGRRDADFDMDDPTLDLDHDLGNGLAIRPPSPFTKQPATKPVNNTFRVERRKDPSLEELEFIVCEFKKKSRYSEKLADIMLKGLEKTLARENYQVFLKGQLPKNWIPIVRMNNDNTPYVEFLIKSDFADQDPESQLNDFTIENMAFSQFIVDYLRDSAIKPQANPTLQNTRALQLQARQSPKVHPQKANHQVVHPSRMNCSTPLSQKKRNISPRESIKNDLNDSKRVLPSRACKANISGRYRVN